MILPWIRVNREAKKTRLVIPGWSILPRYFTQLFPNETLIILNPFMMDEHQLKNYLTNELGGESTQACDQSIQELIQNGLDDVFIFSMGLQWVCMHAPELFELPCKISSPSVQYVKAELEQMTLSLRQSLPATLRAFYRQCFSSNEGWLWWKKEEMKSHIAYNSEQPLIEWLNQLGNVHADIPDVKHITIWLDPNDPIGEKPPLHSSNQTIITHCNGHIVPPQ